MTISPKIQLIIVLIILSLVVIWIVWKLISKRGNGSSVCAGCSLSEMCEKKESLRNDGTMKRNSKRCG